LFGYFITANNYLGIALLLSASVGLCAIDKFSNRWDTLYLMSIAAGLQTIVVTTEKYIFDRTDFFGAFLSITAGIILSGLSCLAFKNFRMTLAQDLPKIQQALPIFIAIELTNLAALYSGQLAVKLGVPVLVSAIEASTPAFAFGLSLLIATWQRRSKARQPLRALRAAKRTLSIKWGLVGLMMMGVWSIGAT
jgi:Na+-translocating ferredoxin:NAD+ oxidoreductase RnfA subunit